MFHKRMARRVGKHGARVRPAIRRSVRMHLGPQPFFLETPRRRLRDDGVPIAGMHRRIFATMEDNGRHGAHRTRPLCAAVLHRGKGGRQVVRRAKGQPRMRTDCGEELRIGGAQDDRHGRSGGHSRDEDALRIDAVIRRDLAGDAREDRGLPEIARLVLRAIPVPALPLVRAGNLRGIGNEKSVALGEFIHPRARGKVLGRLRTPVQHHHQGSAGAEMRIARGDMEEVGAGAGGIGECAFHEFAGGRIDLAGEPVVGLATMLGPRAARDQPGGRERLLDGVRDPFHQPRGLFEACRGQRALDRVGDRAVIERAGRTIRGAMDFQG